jgi:hypothetical protein
MNTGPNPARGGATASYYPAGEYLGNSEPRALLLRPSYAVTSSGALIPASAARAAALSVRSQGRSRSGRPK